MDRESYAPHCFRIWYLIRGVIRILKLFPGSDTHYQTPQKFILRALIYRRSDNQQKFVYRF
jgi:hypothetical protein